jgi:hypothetical protein
MKRKKRAEAPSRECVYGDLIFRNIFRNLQEFDSLALICLDYVHITSPK